MIDSFSSPADSSHEVLRRRMVDEQLRPRDITSTSVLDALSRVPRERFVPADMQEQAYADGALSIDCGQTISQPFIVALMTQALELTGKEKVLEIGTGSGYQTAVLSLLAREVISLERHPELSRQAAKVLAGLGCRNVQLFIGDGTLGRSEFAPYDCILVAATAPDYPRPLFEQLREGGVLVIPLGASEEQTLVRIQKVNGQARMTNLTGCRFVPLIGEHGRREEDL